MPGKTAVIIPAVRVSRHTELQQADSSLDFHGLSRRRRQQQQHRRAVVVEDDKRRVRAGAGQWEGKVTRRGREKTLWADRRRSFLWTAFACSPWYVT